MVKYIHMTSQEILQKYLEFYKDRGHKQIPNVSLVPENDPTLLFVNSGMFPLVPYLSGESHPQGKRLVNVQRCIRMEDLVEIGDATHTLAFHMIGNWSLGDYFKTEQLPWAYKFLIDTLGLDPNKLVSTVFSGDMDAPQDQKSIKILQKIFAGYGIKAEVGERIWLYNKKQGNWWQRGDAIGELGGPSSETFYYLGEGSPEGKSPEDYEDEFVELGNSVFMEYQRTKTGWEKLPQSNVDFGGGLERIAQAVQNKKDIFETDNFWPIIQKIEKVAGKKYGRDKQTTKQMRILADHIRGTVFLAMDGVEPSNKDQGYILRRLLRRMVRAGKQLGIEKDISVSLVPVVVEMFNWLYVQLVEKERHVQSVFATEEEKFRKTLNSGASQVQKILSSTSKSNKITTEKASELAFNLYQSLGYPEEIFLADLSDHNIKINEAKFDELFGERIKNHQESSRAGAEQKFKGGLADQDEQTIKYHTTTHLLHWALREVLGEHIQQRGSNITGERLRFDFSHPQKLTEEEIKRIQTLVNEKIEGGLPVNFEVMNLADAKACGAQHFFEEKYEDKVKVYYIGPTLKDAVTKEFCGGPHVKNTSELDPIEIYKQDKIGEGKMRVYAKSA